MKNIEINNKLLKFIRFNKSLKKSNLELYKLRLKKKQTEINKANNNFFVNYYYLYNKQFMEKPVLNCFIKNMLSKSRKRIRLTTGFLDKESFTINYVSKVSLLKAFLSFLYSNKTSKTLLFPYYLKSKYFKISSYKFQRMFTNFFKKKKNMFINLKNSITVLKKIKYKPDVKFFLKNRALKSFLFEFIKKKYHSVAHEISLAP